MTAVRPDRLLWLVYAAVLTAFAVCGVLVAAAAQLDVTQFQLYVTALVALLAGGTVHAGLALVERNDFETAAWSAIAAAAVEFVLIANAIWSNRSETQDKLAASAFVCLVGALIVLTLRLLVPSGVPAVRGAFLGTVLCQLVTTGVAIKVIWSANAEDARSDLRIFLSFLTLSVFGYLLTPAVKRLSAPSPAP